MAYTPPHFSVVRINTLNLDTKFFNLLKRYKIVDASSSVDLHVQSRLEILLARTRVVIECETERESAQDVFNQLSNELREVLKKKDEVKIKQGTQLLLGALLHRYFRIIQEYETSYWTYFKSLDPRNCRLFMAIREALRLSKEAPPDFKKKDLQLLDSATIVTALQVFRDYMKLEDSDQVPRYMKYDHFKQDVNFERHLDEMIKQYSKEAQPVLNQIKAVDFIQSLSNYFAAEQKQIDEALDKWSKLLAKDHADFSTLDLEKIESHIQTHIESPLMREKILDLLYTPFIQSNIANFDHSSFIVEMKKCYSNIASWTVVGGYSLLLQSKVVEKKLQFCIHEVLGIQENPSVLTEKDLLNGIKFLKQFMENNPAVNLNFEFFGGRDNLNSLICQNEMDLNTMIQKQVVVKEHSVSSLTV